MATKRSRPARRSKTAAASSGRSKTSAMRTTFMSKVNRAAKSARQSVRDLPKGTKRAGKIAAVAAAVVGAAMATRAIVKR